MAEKTKIEIDVESALRIIKNQDAVIKQAFEHYKNEYPEYSVNTIFDIIADESGLSRATVCRKINEAKTERRIIIF